MTTSLVERSASASASAVKSGPRMTSPTPLAGDVVRGLVNRGNTCFLNSTLQGLAVVPPAHGFLRDVVSAAALAGESLEAGASAAAACNAEAAAAVRRLFGRDAEGAPVLAGVDATPPALASAGVVAAGVLSIVRALSWPYAQRAPPALAAHVALGAIASAFDDGAQHDVHELLTRLLQTLDDDGVRLAVAAAVNDERTAAWRSIFAAGGRAGSGGGVMSARARGRARRRACTLEPPRGADGLRPPRPPPRRRQPHHPHAANSALSSLTRDPSRLANPFEGLVAERVVCGACAAWHAAAAVARAAPAATDGAAAAAAAAVNGGAATTGARRNGAAGGTAPRIGGRGPVVRPPPMGAPLPVRPWAAAPFALLSVQPAAPRPPAGAAASAPLPPTQLTLEACLAREFGDEALPPDYRCDGEAALPGVAHRCVKRRALARLPPALCIHVNRLGGLGLGGKVRRRVRFDLSLDAAPFSLAARGRGSRGGGGNATYELVALVEHSGGGGGGHYVTYRRVPAPAPAPAPDASAEGDRDSVAAAAASAAAAAAPLWVCASDAAVRPADVGEVLEREAYLLLYVRRTTSPPPDVAAAAAARVAATTVLATSDAAGAPAVADMIAQGRDGEGACGVWFPDAE